MFTNRQRRIINGTLAEAARNPKITQAKATHIVKTLRGDYPADKIDVSRNDVTVWFDDDTEDQGNALADKIAKRLGSTDIVRQHNRAIIYFGTMTSKGDPMDKASRHHY
jgi:hypothetical protein